MARDLSKKCAKCGEKVYFHQCRCFRCRSVNPLPMVLLSVFFIICNAALGYVLAMLF